MARGQVFVKMPGGWELVAKWDERKMKLLNADVYNLDKRIVELAKEVGLDEVEVVRAAPQ